MGLINVDIGGAARGIGDAITSVAEVFTENDTKRMELDGKVLQSSVQQFAAEFRENRTWFDTAIDGLNRLPRPVMALGTIGLFVYAAVDPVEFSILMQALELIPEPLWYLLGAIVAFYFGAREMQKIRENRTTTSISQVPVVVNNMRQLRELKPGLNPLEAEAPPEVVAQAPTTGNMLVDKWKGLY